MALIGEGEVTRHLFRQRSVQSRGSTRVEFQLKVEDYSRDNSSWTTIDEGHREFPLTHGVDRGPIKQRQ
jgi:hypothetical protein